MILGAVSLIDCLVFVAFLIPQLLLRLGFIRTLEVAVNALPFIGMSHLHRPWLTHVPRPLARGSHHATYLQ